MGKQDWDVGTDRKVCFCTISYRYTVDLATIN